MLWVLSEPWRPGTCTWEPALSRWSSPSGEEHPRVWLSPTFCISTFSSELTWKQSKAQGCDLEQTSKCLSYKEPGWEIKVIDVAKSSYRCSGRKSLPCSSTFHKYIHLNLTQLPSKEQQRKEEMQ